MSKIKRGRALTIAASAVIVVCAYFVTRWTYLSSPTLRGQRTHPRVEAHETAWDFGQVSQSSRLVSRFSVANSGDQRLILRRQSRSCDCLASRHPAVIIPPGSKTELRIDFDPLEFFGKTSEHVEYRTNDPQRPTLRFTLTADVQADPNPAGGGVVLRSVLRRPQKTLETPPPKFTRVLP